MYVYRYATGAGVQECMYMLLVQECRAVCICYWYRNTRMFTGAVLCVYACICYWYTGVCIICYWYRNTRMFTGAVLCVYATGGCICYW